MAIFVKNLYFNIIIIEISNLFTFTKHTINRIIHMNYEINKNHFSLKHGSYLKFPISVNIHEFNTINIHLIIFGVHKQWC